jgi:hypothetical protein
VLAIDYIDGALSRQFQSRAPLSFFQQGCRAKHGTKLLRALVAGDLSRKRFKSRAIPAGENYGPFIVLVYLALLHRFASSMLST